MSPIERDLSRLSIRPQWRVDKTFRREDGPTCREKSLNEAIVKRCVQVSATIADHRKTVIGVSGFDKSGKDDATGRDAQKGQRIDVIGTKNHGKVRAGKGADPVLGYNDLIVLRRDGIGDCSKRFLEQPLMLLRGSNGAEECISGTDLGKSRSKTDFDVDYRHASSASMIEDTCDSSQKRVFGLSGVNGNDAGLTVHAQDGRTGRIDRKCVGQIKLLWRTALPVRIVVLDWATPLQLFICNPIVNRSFRTSAANVFIGLSPHADCPGPAKDGNPFVGWATSFDLVAAKLQKQCGQSVKRGQPCLVLKYIAIAA